MGNVERLMMLAKYMATVWGCFSDEEVRHIGSSGLPRSKLRNWRKSSGCEESTFLGSWIGLDNLGYFKDLVEEAGSQPNFLPRNGMRYEDGL